MSRFVQLTAPTTAHPFVRHLFDLMNEHRVGVVALAGLAGVNKNTLKDWRVRTMPRVSDLQACLNALGYELVILPKQGAVK